MSSDGRRATSISVVGSPPSTGTTVPGDLAADRGLVSVKAGSDLGVGFAAFDPGADLFDFRYHRNGLDAWPATGGMHPPREYTRVDRAPRSGGKSRCDARCVSGGLPLTVESRAVRVVSARGPHPAGVVRAMPARWPGRSGGAGTVCAQPGV